MSDQRDTLSAEWETHRPAVFGVAYRLLGSVADAEDVAQEVWLRAAGADLADVKDLRAWLVTVSARLSYDILKSARARREAYVGPWLPEPLLTGPDASEPVLVDESVSSAILLIMDELSPPERVAFVLHDVFGIEFDRIAEIVGGVRGCLPPVGVAGAAAGGQGETVRAAGVERRAAKGADNFPRRLRGR